MCRWIRGMYSGLLWVLLAMSFGLEVRRVLLGDLQFDAIMNYLPGGLGPATGLGFCVPVVSTPPRPCGYMIESG